MPDGELIVEDVGVGSEVVVDEVVGGFVSEPIVGLSAEMIAKGYPFPQVVEKELSVDELKGRIKELDILVSKYAKEVDYWRSVAGGVRFGLFVR